ncbi:MAG: aldo/keto reductase [Acidobacteria bacterium]|nr:aldo/keto reductase [Acidobacteriota bacterium]
MPTFAPRTLGRCGLVAGALGIGASYGVPAAAVEEAFHRGVNYLYWGSIRRDGFAQAVRNLRSHRSRAVLVLQSFSRIARLMQRSVEKGLRTIGYDHADVLLLGYWNSPVPGRILDGARELRRRGLVRYLAVSSHNRPLLAKLANSSDFDIVHLRYNAFHRGAEQDIFPHLPAGGPGVVAYTATCWGRLLNPARIASGERIPTAADCYRFALSHPAVNLCMTGPASMQECRDGLKALEAGPMDEEELAWMRRIATT